MPKTIQKKSVNPKTMKKPADKNKEMTGDNKTIKQNAANKPTISKPRWTRSDQVRANKLLWEGAEFDPSVDQHKSKLKNGKENNDATDKQDNVPEKRKATAKAKAAAKPKPRNAVPKRMPPSGPTAPPAGWMPTQPMWPNMAVGRVTDHSQNGSLHMTRHV